MRFNTQLQYVCSTDMLHIKNAMLCIVFLLAFSPFIVYRFDHLSKAQTNGNIACMRSEQIQSLCLKQRFIIKILINGHNKRESTGEN